MDQQTHAAQEGVSQLDALIGSLYKQDGLARRQARQQLVNMGEAAVPALTKTLAAKDDHARWEAAKALCEIHAPQSAEALVQRLEDENFSVRWLAAEALIGLGQAAARPLLEALMRRSDSVWLRHGAHHVLSALLADGKDKSLRLVLDTLEGVEPALLTPLAAEKALTQLPPAP